MSSPVDVVGYRSVGKELYSQKLPVIACGVCGRRVTVSKKSIVESHSEKKPIGVWVYQCSGSGRFVVLNHVERLVPAPEAIPIY